MSALCEPEHTDTGYQAIDCVRYRHVPAALSLTEAARNVVLYRIVDYGTETTTSADRPADDHDLLLLTRGSGRAAHGKLAGTRFAVEANRDLRATFVPQGADASVEFGTSARSVNILFPRNCLAGLVEERSRTALSPLLFGRNHSLIGLISLLEMELFRPGLAADMVAEQAMRSIALILSGVDPNGFLVESDRITISPARLRRVIDYVEANLDQPLTLDVLAAVSGLSPFHFSRVFRKATGMSPYRYVSERRFLKAQRLLMADDIQINEIAAACGFARHSNFTAAFTKARQVSPTCYRQHFSL
jgi:AraC-like DNA-binding protein